MQLEYYFYRVISFSFISSKTLRPKYIQNPLAARRATSLADRLGVCIAVLHGECKDDERNDDDGRASPPPNEEQVTSEKGFMRLCLVLVFNLGKTGLLY